jgi:hypothetical protein
VLSPQVPAPRELLLGICVIQHVDGLTTRFVLTFKTFQILGNDAGQKSSAELTTVRQTTRRLFAQSEYSASTCSGFRQNPQN